MDVYFRLTTDNVPTLSSMHDMVINGLYISIQKCRIRVKNIVQNLEMCNFFLVHMWSPADMPFAFYAEWEMRNIHNTFRHLSICVTEGLLRSGNGANI